MKNNFILLLFLLMTFNCLAQDVSIVVYEGKVSFVDKKQLLLPKTRYSIYPTTLIEYDPGSKFTIFSKNKIYNKTSNGGAALNYQKVLQNLNASTQTGFLKLMATYKELNQMETAAIGSSFGAAKGLNDRKDTELIASEENMSPIDSAKTGSKSIDLNWKLKNSIMGGRLYVIHQLTKDTIYNQPATNIGKVSIPIEKTGNYDWFIYSKIDKKKRINQSFVKLSEEEDNKLKADFEDFKKEIVMFDEELQAILIEEYKKKFGIID